jgi:tetratricopeptide (TPR) repeat protein
MEHRTMTARSFPLLSFSRRVAVVLSLAVTASVLAIPTLPAQTSDSRRGAALFEANDFAGARAAFEAVLRQSSNDPNALYYMGRIALQQSNSSEAVDWLEKAIAVNDENADYHVWLGSALGEEAMHASKFRQPFLARRVKTEFERAVALDPRNVTARFGLVQFYTFAPGFMGGSMEKARQQAAELAGISPLQGHLAAAFLAIREKNNAAAEREYEGAITVAPDSSSGYIALGVLMQRQERWNDALVAFDRLLKRRPEEMSAHYQIGRTAALSGQSLDRGEQSLKLWLARPPRTVQPAILAGAHLRLGQIYERKGRHDAARAELEEALRINPRNDEARRALAALK